MNPSPRIAVYVSGHGFGHAARLRPLLAELGRFLGATLLLRTAAPAFLFEGLARATRIDGDCDIGLVQADGLGGVDLDETVRRWRDAIAGWDTLVAAEVAHLRAFGAQLVLADIPPLAFAAAAAAGLPSAGIGNFGWDWIYRDLDAPALGPIADHIATCYGRAQLLLELPFAGDMSAFPYRVRVPLLGQPAPVDGSALRRALGLAADARLALISFGGLGARRLDLAALCARYPELHFVVPAGAPPGRAVNAANLHPVDRRHANAALVAGCDLVLTKPGYGIVSECLLNGARVIYTDRGPFAEYPLLAAALEAHLDVAYVNQSAMLAGHLGDAPERLLALPRRPRPVVPDRGERPALGPIVDLLRG